ncbi:NAD(P)/FAD-dependent oxidoreductase, partial [Streptomyces carpinensis]
VTVRTSCRVTGAEAAGSTVRLEVAGPGRAVETLAVDHVLAATGYRLDLEAVSFLSPAVRRALECVPGSSAPRLSAGFESSVPGLHFTGSLAAPMFGPMMRFVAGVEYAATRVARALADRRAAR